MKIETNEYGYQFVDLGGGDILQQSSWGGGHDPALKHPPPGKFYVWLGKKDHRMLHLNREQVRELVKHLTNWLEKGEF